MAKQLNFLCGEVIPTSLTNEMQQSYLEYAMSVIVGRALPDVRDGLKPVHRRILYAMHELGLTPDRPYRKCARVVGDVLGKYHPHGDQSVYDALVRLVQEFSSRYPLLAGHGNFGSVDNDPPAAMRYTETRLATIGNEGLLTQVGEATVDFTSNFDNSQQEPTVLPAQLPFLILNGSSGIAVGMATNIPPHNLGEVVDGLIALIDNPDLCDQKLMQLIPGPDFPTGGEIIATEGIKEAYTSGRGSIVMRGVAKIEQVATAGRKRTKNAIVVTELPFQVNKAGWIEKVAALVNAGKLEGISDIRDESDREGIRVVIELKREATPEVVLHNLYQHTDLMSKFGAIFLALVNSQPRQLSLKQILEEFLGFREQTLLRRYRSELEIAERREHLVGGLLKALSALDEVIDILRNAPDGSSAKMSLETRLDFSTEQADAILAMPLRRLTGLEGKKLQEEATELAAQIQRLRRLLSERSELLKSLKKELRSLKRRYSDPRRTRIVSSESQESQSVSARSSKGVHPPSKATESKILRPQLPAVEETLVEMTLRGYVRRVTPHNLSRPQSREDITIEAIDDFPVTSYLTTTAETLVIINRMGKAYPLNVADIPSVSLKSRGVPLITLLSPSATKDASTRPQDLIVAAFLGAGLQSSPVRPKTDADQRERAFSDQTDLIMLSAEGKIKRLSGTDFMDLSARGITVMKLKDNDELSYANLAATGDQVVLATSGGRLLRLDINADQIPVMGRTAQGSVATRLRKNEQLVGCITLSSTGELNNKFILLVSEQGYFKRISLQSLQRSRRGGIGTQMLQFRTRDDACRGLAAITPGEVVYCLTSENRMVTLVPDVVPVWGKDGHGDRMVKLRSGERILSVVSPIYGTTIEG
ncbi:DNA gyrase/topoisomerase IV subunit A [Limnospira platensis CENA597]|uniref:DNA gyrase/topoisomerase IV subunit A n=1 Tax=Limnospira platensis TaxID=118562 RepID=UPI003DA152A4